MQYTNKAKIHPAIAAYLQSQHYFLKGDISCTRLISSPRATQLEKRHDKDIIVDVSELYKAKAGTEYHGGVERFIKANPDLFPGVVSETKFKMDVMGWVVTGTADIIDKLTKQLWDMKNSSVWAMMFGVKHEHKAQLNIYKAMAKEIGIDIERLFIAFGFTDWHKSDLYKKDYPQLAIDFLEIPVWSAERTMDYIEDRVEYHQESVETPDEDLPDCTGYGTESNERWEKPSKFAIYSGKYAKSKRAAKLCDSLDDAQAWVNSKKEPAKYSIYFRRGVQTKCEDWCDASPFCSQWKELQATAMEEI